MENMASFVEVMSWFKKMHECNRLLPNCGNCPMGTKVAQVLGIEPVRITTIKQSP